MTSITTSFGFAVALGDFDTTKNLLVDLDDGTGDVEDHSFCRRPSLDMCEVVSLPYLLALSLLFCKL